jgi:hypothetical protein
VNAREREEKAEEEGERKGRRRSGSLLGLGQTRTERDKIRFTKVPTLRYFIPLTENRMNHVTDTSFPSDMRLLALALSESKRARYNCSCISSTNIDFSENVTAL